MGKFIKNWNLDFQREKHINREFLNNQIYHLYAQNRMNFIFLAKQRISNQYNLDHGPKKRSTFFKKS